MTRLEVSEEGEDNEVEEVPSLAAPAPAVEVVDISSELWLLFVSAVTETVLPQPLPLPSLVSSGKSSRHTGHDDDGK
jgi:hypothetical protein